MPIPQQYKEAYVHVDQELRSGRVLTSKDLPKILNEHGIHTKRASVVLALRMESSGFKNIIGDEEQIKVNVTRYRGRRIFSAEGVVDEESPAFTRARAQVDRDIVADAGSRREKRTPVPWEMQVQAQFETLLALPRPRVLPIRAIRIAEATIRRIFTGEKKNGLPSLGANIDFPGGSTVLDFVLREKPTDFEDIEIKGVDISNAIEGITEKRFETGFDYDKTFFAKLLLREAAFQVLANQLGRPIIYWEHTNYRHLSHPEMGNELDRRGYKQSGVKAFYRVAIPETRENQQSQTSSSVK